MNYKEVKLNSSVKIVLFLILKILHFSHAWVYQRGLMNE